MFHRNFVTNAIKISIIWLFLSLIFSHTTQANVADLTYHLTVCGESGAPAPSSRCYVQTPSVTPDPASIANLHQALYDFFFISENTQDFSYQITGATSTGYVYGTTMDSGFNLVAQFIYHDGIVICCHLDTPFYITAINDNSIVLANYSYGSYIMDIPPDANPVEWASINLDSASRAYLTQNYPLLNPDFFNFDPFMNLYAIDDANRISGLSYALGSFILTPVPEPNGLLMLLTALALLVLKSGAWRWKNSRVIARS